MIIELAILILIFALVLATNAFVFKILLLPAIFVCLPGIFGLRSAPYVPTLKKNVETMLSFASIKPGMKVYDLGAGDGRLVAKASKLGAQAIGYEISIGLVLYFWLKKMILTIFCHPRDSNGGVLEKLENGNPNIGKSRVYWGSLWSKDISHADVVMCFLMPNAMERFEREKFPSLKKGARFISNIFPMPKTKADKEANNVYLYIKK